MRYSLTAPRAHVYSCHMSTGPQCIARFVTINKVGISSFEKNFRSHRAAGQVPTAKPGGGVNAIHLGSYPVAYVLLGMASFAPRLAADAAARLAQLDWADPQPGDVSGLLNVLAGEIEMRAARIYKGLPPSPYDEPEDWSLTVCLDPLRAWTSTIVNGQEKRRYFTSAKPETATPSSRRGIQRLTIINTYVLNVAAELVADTLAHRADKTKTAAPPGRDAAARLNQDLDDKTQEVPNPGFTRSDDKAQAPSQRGPGRTSKVPRKVTHGPSSGPPDRYCAVSA